MNRTSQTKRNKQKKSHKERENEYKSADTERQKTVRHEQKAESQKLKLQYSSFAERKKTLGARTKKRPALQ